MAAPGPSPRGLRAVVLCALVALGGGACAHYTGPSRSITRQETEQPGWLRAPSIVEQRQRSTEDCGAAAAAVVAARWQGAAVAPVVMASTPVPKRGLRAVQIRDLLRGRGLRSFVIAGTFADLEHELAAGRPVIVGTVKPMSNGKALRHYEVVVALLPAERRVVTFDPSNGWRQQSYAELDREWKPSARTAIVSLP